MDKDSKMPHILGRLSRRAVMRSMVVGAGATAVLALAGCGTKAEEAPAAQATTAAAAATAAPVVTTAAAAAAQQKAVTIRVWIVNQNDETQKVHNDTIYPSLKAKAPNITIEPRWLNWDRNIETILTAIAAGDTPELFELGAEHSITFAEKNQIMAIDDWLKGWDATADFYPEAMQTPWWKGHFYGLPHLIDAQVAFWRMDILEGLGITEPPTTWEQMVEVTDKATEVEAGALKREGFGFHGAQEYFMNFMAASRTPIIVGGKSSFGRPDGYAAMQYLIDRWQVSRGKVGGAELPKSPIPYLITGQRVGEVSSMYSVKIIKEQKPELLSSVAIIKPPVPGNETYKIEDAAKIGPIVQSFNDWMAVGAVQKDPDATWTVLQHLMTVENLILYNKTYYFIPPRKSAATQDYMTEKESQLNQKLLEQYGVAAPKMPQQNAFYKAFSDQLDLAVRKQIEPKAAVDKAVAEQDKLMADEGFTGSIVPNDDIFAIPQL